MVSACSKEGLRQRALAFHRRQHELHDLPQGRDLRPAQFVDRSGLGLSLDGERDGCRYIADEDRLQLSLAAANEGQGGHVSRHGGEAIEELVFGAEHHRGAQHDGARECLLHQSLAPRFAARIARGAGGVGPDRRKLHENVGAGGLGRLGEGLGALRMHGIEGLLPGLAKDADEVDDRLGVAQRVNDELGIAQIGLNRVDLADLAERLSERRDRDGARRPSRASRRAPAPARHGGR